VAATVMEGPDTDVDTDAGNGPHPQHLSEVAGFGAVVAPGALQFDQGRGRGQRLYDWGQVSELLQDLPVDHDSLRTRGR
jgi:hypothetical protein